MTLKLGTEIPGTSADGNITTLWVPTIKDIKAPTMAELEAGTDISNYVMLGDISIEVIDNTNTEHQEQNEAVTLMHEGASGYIVRRRGMATDTPLAVGQKLTVVSVIYGEKQVINPDASTMIRSKIPLFAKAPGWESETAEISNPKG